MVECFPRWLVWTLGSALVLTGAQMLVLAAIGLRQPAGYRFRYARRFDPWPAPVFWACGVKDCRHKYRIPAWLHAAWRRPWRLRGGD